MHEDEAAVRGLKVRGALPGACRPGNKGAAPVDQRPRKLKSALLGNKPVGYYSKRTVAARCATGPICRHCVKCVVNRPRGLCWGCYYTPGVREQYPSTSKYAKRGAGPTGAGARPLPTPTDAPAGSLEKMKVMHARLNRGEQLHHPDDNRAIHADNPFPGDHYRGSDDNGLTDLAGALVAVTKFVATGAA